MNIVEHEISKIRKRYNFVLKKLIELSTHSNEYKYIINRLLKSKFMLSSIMGGLNKYGYSNSLTDSPLEIMEFVSFFVAHELMDDGDPGLSWNRWNFNKGVMEECNEGDERAQPFCHRRNEIIKPWKPFTNKDLIWIMDWHRDFENKLYDDEEDEKYKDNEIDIMLENIAKEIEERAGIQSFNPYDTSKIDIKLIFIIDGEDIDINTSLLTPLYISKKIALQKGNYRLSPDRWIIYNEWYKILDPSKTPYFYGLDHLDRLFLIRERK